jgi:hypothetical protein
MRRDVRWAPLAFLVGTLICGCQIAKSEEIDEEGAAAQPGIVTPGGTGPLSGAISTKTADGTLVTEDARYRHKAEVYLASGAGPYSPPTARGLPEGDYFFQVTDPSGERLLSEDHISCRKLHVNSQGAIDFVYQGTNYVRRKLMWKAEPCQHEFATQVDYSELGTTTVQLLPYDDTPDDGGAYKVWTTRVEEYVGEPITCSGAAGCNVNGAGREAGAFHGFIARDSKTYTFRVPSSGHLEPSAITVRRFHDKNLNCTRDPEEEDIAGPAVQVTEPSLVVNTLYAPETIVAGEPGTYTFVEEAPESAIQTVGILDGITVSKYPDADPMVAVFVEAPSENPSAHEVVFGYAGSGLIRACSIYDRDSDGEADAGEPGLSGWRIELTGIDVRGMPVGPLVRTTSADGCTAFVDLLPGDYTLTEHVPAPGAPAPQGATFQKVTIESSLTDSYVSGTAATVRFMNRSN